MKHHNQNVQQQDAQKAMSSGKSASGISPSHSELRPKRRVTDKIPSYDPRVLEAISFGYSPELSNKRRYDTQEGVTSDESSGGSGSAANIVSPESNKVRKVVSAVASRPLSGKGAKQPQPPLADSEEWSPQAVTKLIRLAQMYQSSRTDWNAIGKVLRREAGECRERYERAADESGGKLWSY